MPKRTRTSSEHRVVTPPRPQRPSPPRAGASTHGRWTLLVVAAVTVVIVAALAFLALRGTTTDDGRAMANAELEHVHGLGVDPESGTLYAGTHYGLFSLPDTSEPTLVAGRVQDFMGFTVAGPDHFLASGHPGAGQEGPASLGLIESTDGGQEWRTLSLAGEADFHALEYRHGQVYGFNAMTGEFMVSQDMESWESRTNLPMADFAVSPEDADAILATTQQGLARTEDGGRTFALVSGAPSLLLVSWADDGTLVGLEPNGTVQVSTDGGESWEQRGTLDASPEALVAVSEDEVYAASGGAVLASTDGGQTFSVRVQG